MSFDPKRLAFFTPHWAWGGAERWLCSLVRELDPTRYEVVAIATRDYSLPPRSFTRSLPGGTPISLGACSFREIANRSDAVITWGIPDLSMLAGYDRPVIQVGHGDCQWTRDCCKTADPQITHYVAVSTQAAKSFTPGKPLTIIHNGIDAGRCTPTADRATLRKLLEIPPYAKVIVHAGRFIPEKGPLAPVWAAKHLGPPWIAMLIGDGPFREPYFKQALAYDPRTLCRPPINQIGDVYNVADCFCSASVNEGFCLSLVEAWYCGLPTITTNVGACELLEETDHNTITFPEAYTPQILADAVRRVTSPQAAGTRHRLQALVQQNFLDTHMARRWMTYLDTLHL